MGSTRFRVAAGLAAVVALFVGVSEVQTQQSEDGNRVIHRYLDPGRFVDGDDNGGQESGTGGEISVDRASRPQPQPGEAPGLWLSPSSGEWIWTPRGPVGPAGVDAPHGGLGDHAGSTPLDGETDQVDELNYQSTFQPSVIPFKRGGTHDRIGRTGDGNYVAQLSTPRFRRLPIGGSLRQGEEQFWGSFLVRMEPGARQRIPSVSPHQRVLTVRTEPQVQLEVFQDQADNFYISADYEGLVRVNMELGAERDYFDGVLDDGVGWEEFDAYRQLDDDLRDRARTVLRMVGVEREEMTPRRALEELVRYHREFESRPLDADDGADRYVEISRRKVGVCRHRALTFMIGAKELGIDTRYVYNEAHAFVEVYWPGQGWRRIDLGGAAEAVDAQNLESGQVHDAMFDDEFPRPDNYEEEMAGLQGDFGDHSRDQTRSHHDDAVMPVADDEMDVADDAGPDSPFETAEDAGRERGDAGGGQVELLAVDGEVYRGETIEVTGRVVSPVQPGTTVQVALVAVGARQFERGELLGETDVGADGYFRAQWEVPRQVSLGRWRVDARVVQPE